MAPCSAAIVRMKNATKRPEASQEMRATTGANILLAIDDSTRFSEAATQVIVQQMRPEQTEVCVLHVVEPLFFTTDTGEHKLLEKGRQLVMRSAQLLGQAGFQVKTAVEDGDPRTAIVDYAAHHKVDLIVVGCHGRKGMDRFLIGSVSENIARHAHCSVEIVRTPATQAT
jgi:nucleotide-binding universal stress UspA family protein